jgi:soluble lytic murein transglycosylase-like protein
VFCAVLAAAGNYSIANAQWTGDPDNQTALAVPRVGLRGSPEVALPQPLAPSEVARVRRIFALQAAGNVAEAARETERLENPLLLGAILADRYLNPGYRPTPAELSTWLARFGDEPDATAIQGLLDRLAPAASTTGYEAIVAETGRHSRKAASPSQVRSLFINNRDADAVAAAQPLLAGGSNATAADSLLAGGLAALRMGELPSAHAMFEASYRAASSQSQRAAGAFWVARTEQRRHDRGSAAIWLRLAAQETGTFYGAIARRALGPTLDCTSQGTIGSADIDALVAAPAGLRAFALLQIGDKRRAEGELRVLWLDAGQSQTYARPLFMLAHAVGLPQLAAEVQQSAGGYDRTTDGDALPGLRPEGGFVVDPSLVYALVRHESNFRAAVVSRSGARGLMQIMPATARAIGEQAGQLHDPAANLAIGQRYLLVLSEDESVDGDLIRLLAGYGQGLYGMKRWADAVQDDGDPLIFLEAIPNPHTRVFIEEALSYSWQYAAQLHVPPTSLDALAAGRFPHLVRTDARKTGGNACVRTAAAR